MTRSGPWLPGDNEQVVEIKGDGKPHRLRLELFLGGNQKRPELGETSVSLDGDDGLFRILSPNPIGGMPSRMRSFSRFASGMACINAT